MSIGTVGVKKKLPYFLKTSPLQWYDHSLNNSGTMVNGVVITMLTAVKRGCNNNTHCCKMALLWSRKYHYCGQVALASPSPAPVACY